MYANVAEGLVIGQADDSTAAGLEHEGDEIAIPAPPWGGDQLAVTETLGEKGEEY
jgi:hypothetical protein